MRLTPIHHHPINVDSMKAFSHNRKRSECFERRQNRSDANPSFIMFNIEHRVGREFWMELVTLLIFLLCVACAPRPPFPLFRKYHNHSFICVPNSLMSNIMQWIWHLALCTKHWRRRLWLLSLSMAVCVDAIPDHKGEWNGRIWWKTTKQRKQTNERS